MRNNISKKMIKKRTIDIILVGFIGLGLASLWLMGQPTPQAVALPREEISSEITEKPINLENLPAEWWWDPKVILGVIIASVVLVGTLAFIKQPESLPKTLEKVRDWYKGKNYNDLINYDSSDTNSNTSANTNSDTSSNSSSDISSNNSSDKSSDTSSDTNSDTSSNTNSEISLEILQRADEIEDQINQEIEEESDDYEEEKINEFMKSKTAQTVRRELKKWQSEEIEIASVSDNEETEMWEELENQVRASCNLGFDIRRLFAALRNSQDTIVNPDELRLFLKLIRNASVGPEIATSLYEWKDNQEDMTDDEEILELLWQLGEFLNNLISSF